MQMAHWVLVPETFHLKAPEMKKWAAKAHEICATLEKKPKKKAPASSVTQKTSAKKGS